MWRRLIKSVVLTSSILALTACAQNGTVYKTIELPGGKVLVTSPEVRVVTQVRTGRTNPKYITCAEPSPDVAKVVADAFSLSGSLKANLPSNITPEIAGAISRAHAEQIAQLTERLATIQLLRDGLYRACEAYANGAISPRAYAVMISRYDDTMITMLLGEFVAGAFGRPLAVIGTEAKSRTPPQQPEQQQPGVSSEAKGSTGTQPGSLESKQDAHIAKTLSLMQRTYLQNLNYDAVEIACIMAVDEAESSPELTKALVEYSEAKRLHADKPTDASRKRMKVATAELATGAKTAHLTPLATFCVTNVFPAVDHYRQILLDHILQKIRAERDEAREFARLKRDVKDATEYLKGVEKLLKQAGKLQTK
ncbi:MAG: hypothetical protein ACE5HC_13665 [Candidatus Binatia bacterium]